MKSVLKFSTLIFCKIICFIHNADMFRTILPMSDYIDNDNNSMEMVTGTNCLGITKYA